MSNDIAIKVENVSKTFKLPHDKNTSIKGAVINFYKRKRTFEKQQALKNVSFEVKKGEFFGIVGRNGSGKSTLLKLLAGIYTPSKGSIQVNGKLTPFIELGVGFNQELSGRENVFLNGALLGFNRKEMEAMYDDIVAFAELERFMDQKLKNYSSGMQVRLAFSIAIRAETDILLIDEVLAVGDAAFQQKCYGVFADMRKMGRTMVLVTHDMNAVSRFCDRAFLINDGIEQQTGKPKKIADAYLELNYEGNASKENSATSQKASSNKAIKITNVAINGQSEDKINLHTDSEYTITITYSNLHKEAIQFGLQISNDAGNYCFGTNTRIAGIEPTQKAKGAVELKIKLGLVPGNYNITAAIMDKAATKVLVYKPDALSFRVSKTTEVEGIANLRHEWSTKDV